MSMYSDADFRQLATLLKIFAAHDARYKIRLRSWDDLKLLPISGRTELISFAAKYPIKNAFNITATSGSTTSRLIIAQSKESHAEHTRRLVRIYRRLGVKPGAVCLNLCAYELNSGGRLMETAFKAVGAGVIPLGPINSPDKLQDAVRLIMKFRPDFVNAYTNQLYDLFTTVGRRHSIKRCLVNGELLWPEYRHRMQVLGNVKIHDHYGAMEFSGLAVAVSPDDEYMEVFAEGLLLEVLSDSGKASDTGVGDLVVTDLANQCMPFIRYRLGDRVDLVRRKNSLWIKVLGRTNESLLVNGVVVIKTELIRVVNDHLEHPNFFFILEKDQRNYGDKLIINVTGDHSSKLVSLIRTVCAELGLPRCVAVRRHAGAVPRTFNGKIRYFINADTKQIQI